jgi:hypothetical protein
MPSLNRYKEITIQKTEHKKQNKKHLHFLVWETVQLFNKFWNVFIFLSHQINSCSDLGNVFKTFHLLAQLWHFLSSKLVTQISFNSATKGQMFVRLPSIDQEFLNVSLVFFSFALNEILRKHCYISFI